MSKDSEFWKVPRYIYADADSKNTDEMIPLTLDELKANVENWDEDDADNLIILQVLPTAMVVNVETKKVVTIENLPQQ